MTRNTASMRREPQQARSVTSMHRMLDSAEALLASGGPDALTVDAVVRESHTSVGSFYARFGDRQGLLVAMQDRFLERLGESFASGLESTNEDLDLEAAIERLVSGFLGAFRSHRSAFNAFMLLNRSEPSMRARGAEASRAAGKSISVLLAHHADQIAHPKPELAADFVYRTLFALATQTVMFDDREVTSRHHSQKTWVDETSNLVLAYLRGPRHRYSDERVRS